MADSLEQSCEQIEVLLLQAQAGLSGVSVVRYDEDTQVEKDRIIVKAMPREVELMGKGPNDIFFWRFPVSISVHLVSRSQATMDAYILAIEAANSGTPAAAAVTLATSKFPAGIDIDNTDSGSRENQDNARTRERVFNFIAKA